MIKVKRKEIHYEHDVVYYVLVYQKDYDDNGELLLSPIFTYRMSEATKDEQMAWSFGPDYLLELKGHFNATTKPLIIKDSEDD
jgi:hypothetical protein